LMKIVLVSTENVECESQGFALECRLIVFDELFEISDAAGEPRRDEVGVGLAPG
jgi:hypothetical protein